MMIAYALEHQPPAPMVQITASSVVNRRLRRVLPALLDTGADVTALPEFCLSALKLYPIAELQLEGIEAQRRSVFLYAAQISIAEIVIPRQEIVLSKFKFAVIGSDIINRFNVHLYGPQLAFEINR